MALFDDLVIPDKAESIDTSGFDSIQLPQPKQELQTRPSPDFDALAIPEQPKPAIPQKGSLYHEADIQVQSSVPAAATGNVGPTLSPGASPAGTPQPSSGTPAFGPGVGAAFTAGLEKGGIGRATGTALAALPDTLPGQKAFGERIEQAPYYQPKTIPEQIGYQAGSLFQALPLFVAGRNPWAGGALQGAGEAILDKMTKAPGAKEKSVVKEGIRGAVTMGPLGFLKPAKTFLGALGLSVPQAGIVTTANALWEAITEGKIPDAKKLASDLGGNAAAFAVMNALFHGMTPKQMAKLTPEQKAAMGSPLERPVNAAEQYLLQETVGLKPELPAKEIRPEQLPPDFSSTLSQQAITKRAGEIGKEMADVGTVVYPQKAPETAREVLTGGPRLGESIAITPTQPVTVSKTPPPKLREVKPRTITDLQTLKSDLSLGVDPRRSQNIERSRAALLDVYSKDIIDQRIENAALMTEMLAVSDPTLMYKKAAVLEEAYNQAAATKYALDKLEAGNPEPFRSLIRRYGKFRTPTEYETSIPSKITPEESLVQEKQRELKESSNQKRIREYIDDKFGLEGDAIIEKESQLEKQRISRQSISDAKLSQYLSNKLAMETPSDSISGTGVVWPVNMTAEEAAIPSFPDARSSGVWGSEGAIGQQQQLRISIPPRSPISKVQSILDKQRSDLDAHDKFSFSRLRDKIASGIVDVAAPMKRRLAENTLGSKAGMMLDLSRGSSAEAVRQFDNAYKAVYSGVPRNAENLFADYLQVIRTMELANSGAKNPGGMTASEASQWLLEVRSQQPQLAARLDAAANQYWNTMHEQVQQLYANGLINKASRNALLSKGAFYSPRIFIQHLDDMSRQSVGGKPVTVTDSGIQAIKEGSEQSLVNSPKFLLSQVIARTQARIAKNNANLALVDYVRQTPNNTIKATIETPKSYTQNGQPAWGDVPSGMERISAVENGQRIGILVPKEMAQYWVTSDPQLNSELMKVIEVMSGSKIVRSFATGINPEFAIANIPRDLVHSWLTTKEYNPVIPLAWAQQAVDFGTVAKDVFGNKGRAIDYIKEGGGMDFLTTQGKLGGKPWDRTSQMEESVSQVGKVLGWLGEKSELWTRLALRERAIKNGATPQEATNIARQYIDFAQGGKWVKAANSAIPYLNAGVQGTRGIFRAFKQNRAIAIFKVGQLMTLATGLAYWNRKVNETAWQEISDNEKTNNWIITTPFSYTDKDGNNRHLYFRIPKDAGQKVFSAIGEEMSERYNTGVANHRRVLNAAAQFLPVDITTSLPPTASAILSYVLNKDFWTKEDIWKGRQVSPEEEYLNSTPEALVAFGKATGMSPERSKVALNKVIPYNPYTWLMSAAWKQMVPDEKTNQKMTDEIGNIPFLRKAMRSTTPMELNEIDKSWVKKLNIKTADENGQPIPVRVLKQKIREAKLPVENESQQLDRQLDLLIARGKGGMTTKSDVKNFIASAPIKQRERIIGRLTEKYGKIYRKMPE